MSRESDSEENKEIDLSDGFIYGINRGSFDTQNSDGTEPARLPGWNLTLAISEQERNKPLAGALRNLERARDTLGDALKNGSLTPGLIEQQMNAADNALEQVFATFLNRIRSRRRRQKDPTDSLRWLEGEFGRLKTLTHQTLSFCNHAYQHSEEDTRAAWDSIHRRSDQQGRTTAGRLLAQLQRGRVPRPEENTKPAPAISPPPLITILWGIAPSHTERHNYWSPFIC